MGLDLVGTWILSFFGACAAGGALGWLAGRLVRFEVGLGIGLLLPGLVSLAFAAALLHEYRAFRDDPARAFGTVVAIEDRPAGPNATTPVAIVEYETPDGVRRRAASRGGTSLAVGDAAVVRTGPDVPDDARVGQPGALRGGAIAALLFGSFPFSAALFFLVTAAVGDGRAGAGRPRRPDWRTGPAFVANGLIVAGLGWAGVSPEPVARTLLVTFGLASAGLWVHCAHGLYAGAPVAWWMVVAVIAVNFSVFTLALWLVQPGGW